MLRFRGSSHSPSRAGASAEGGGEGEPSEASPLFRILVCVPVGALVVAVTLLLLFVGQSRMQQLSTMDDPCPNLSNLHPGVTSVDLRRCRLHHIPNVVYEFDSVTTVDLSENEITQVPSGFCTGLPNVEVVFLSENSLQAVPDMSKCKNLRILSLKRNKIAEFKDGMLPETIQWLMLTDNRLTALPVSFGRFTKLQKLMLTGNQLSGLPKSVGNLVSLELVRLAANQLSSVPEDLFRLPRLSWISLSGNPMGPPRDASPSLRIEQWNRVVKGELMGEGTSGMVYRGYLRSDKSTPLAIKIFKNELTNDGLAVDEVDTSLAASEATKATNLVTPVAKVVGHPENRQVLLYKLLDSHTKLGNPPSLTTCTRDLFYSAKFIGASEQVLLQILVDLAGALNELHLRGIMHGDFYAHNILCVGIHDCRLSDFGGSSRMHAKWALAAQRVEVRSFGVLMDDLLPFFPDPKSPTVARLTRVKNITFDETVPSKRPLMGEVVELLKKAKQ